MYNVSPSLSTSTVPTPGTDRAETVTVGTADPVLPPLPPEAPGVLLPVTEAEEETLEGAGEAEDDTEPELHPAMALPPPAATTAMTAVTSALRARIDGVKARSAEIDSAGMMRCSPAKEFCSGMPTGSQFAAEEPLKSPRRIPLSVMCQESSALSTSAESWIQIQIKPS
jgi:hypothetical protein